MEPDDEPQPHSSTSRLRRALTLGALSVLVLALASLSYLHPGWSLIPAGAAANNSNVAGSRHLAAVDFVTPTIGWVVVEQQPRDFVVLHTSDAGETWVRQLAGYDAEMSEYLHFFDASHGVVAILGTQAALYRTSNGGHTWMRQSLISADGLAISADFIDPDHGWLLAEASTEGEALLRTDDGGKTWVELGTPVAFSDWAYRVAFSDRANGWLYSRSSGLYAYRSGDGGSSWQRIALPGPPGGRPNADGVGVSVEARPTKGAGVSVTVVTGRPAILLQPLGASATEDSPRQKRVPTQLKRRRPFVEAVLAAGRGRRHRVPRCPQLVVDRAWRAGEKHGRRQHMVSNPGPAGAAPVAGHGADDRRRARLVRRDGGDQTAGRAHR
ncbi:MAG TPA: hypothetical protein VIP57_12770 [Candidatus Dormibacteraeota bacterium]